VEGEGEDEQNGVSCEDWGCNRILF